MELWELNHCIKAYNSIMEAESRERTIMAWRMAAFSGAAFAGKLKPLKHYLRNNGPGKKAPKVSKEEFEARLSRAKGHTGPK